MQPGRGRKFVALRKPMNSARVMSNLASAKGLAKVTWCCGSSRPASVVGTSKRWFSPGGAPIWKLPAGITTISGQFGQSRKVFGGALLAMLGCVAGCGKGAGCGAAAGVGAGAGTGVAGGIAIGADGGAGVVSTGGDGVGAGAGGFGVAVGGGCGAGARAGGVSGSVPDVGGLPRAGAPDRL